MSTAFTPAEFNRQLVVLNDTTERPGGGDGRVHDGAPPGSGHGWAGRPRSAMVENDVKRDTYPMNRAQPRSVPTDDRSRA